MKLSPIFLTMLFQKYDTMKIPKIMFQTSEVEMPRQLRDLLARGNQIASSVKATFSSDESEELKALKERARKARLAIQAKRLEAKVERLERKAGQ